MIGFIGLRYGLSVYFRSRCTRKKALTDVCVGENLLVVLWFAYLGVVDVENSLTYFSGWGWGVRLFFVFIYENANHSKNDAENDCTAHFYASAGSADVGKQTHWYSSKPKDGKADEEF